MNDTDPSFRTARRPAATIIAYRVVGTFVIALLGWVVLGFVATVPLGAVFGWSGHPAMPAAPLAVYVGVYLVALPILCLAAAWKAMRWVEGRVRRVTESDAR